MTIRQLSLCSVQVAPGIHSFPLALEIFDIVQRNTTLTWSTYISRGATIKWRTYCLGGRVAGRTGVVYSITFQTHAGCKQMNKCWHFILISSFLALPCCLRMLLYIIMCVFAVTLRRVHVVNSVSFNISPAGAHVVTVIMMIDAILCCRCSADGSIGWQSNVTSSSSLQA